jgi:hypothetical protein
MNGCGPRSSERSLTAGNPQQVAWSNSTIGHKATPIELSFGRKPEIEIFEGGDSSRDGRDRRSGRRLPRSRAPALLMTWRDGVDREQGGTSSDVRCAIPFLALLRASYARDYGVLVSHDCRSSHLIRGASRVSPR